ncbi:MAG: ATP-dependent Clp protease adapter ClpS [Magnetococcales bacterium]|nr:ATP-dependent Clp protease adapter ClpS [Magnetococcales bacterium]
MSRHSSRTDEETLTRTRVKEPSLFKVVLLNDDFTPMDFVVDLLMGLFQKSEEEATTIMLNIHHKGQGLCGIYTRDIAETKVNQVHALARNADHPLKCRMEKA